jgi:ubiquitin C-terminal hydrolase
LGSDCKDSELETTWLVERSLQQFFKLEKCELKCERCDAGKAATQTLEIISRPKALILHFKGFIATQQVHAGQSTGEASDDTDNAVVPPKMEMNLCKNEVNYLLVLCHCPVVSTSQTNNFREYFWDAERERGGK